MAANIRIFFGLKKQKSHDFERIVIKKLAKFQRRYLHIF